MNFTFVCGGNLYMKRRGKNNGSIILYNVHYVHTCRVFGSFYIVAMVL